MEIEIVAKRIELYTTCFPFMKEILAELKWNVEFKNQKKILKRSSYTIIGHPHMFLFSSSKVWIYKPNWNEKRLWKLHLGGHPFERDVRIYVECVKGLGWPLVDGFAGLEKSLIPYLSLGIIWADPDFLDSQCFPGCYHFGDMF